MADSITNKFVDIDFGSNRNELIRFLSSKTEFQDFSFEGPAIALLLDALAFTTHELALYANLSLSEVFLDSAQLRGPVVSHAKALGYTTRSASAAYAEIDITLTLGNSRSGLTDIFIPRGAKFAADVAGQSYNFVTTDRFQLLEKVAGSGTYTATIVVFEGLMTRQTFPFTAESSNQTFRLNNKTVDTKFISVVTQEVASSNNVVEWFPAQNIVTVNDASNVFFVQEGTDGYYELYFGDNIIGRSPSVGATIIVDYLITNGSRANGVSTFALIDSVVRYGLDSGNEIFPGTAFSITVVNPAGYGAERESVESIKAAAPRTYEAQNRAVTKGDYVTLLQNAYGFIETISVWGGQDNDPPQYGKVFISIKPKYDTSLSPLTKAEIREKILSRYSIVGITPEIVDPDFTYIYADSTVFFRKEQTILTDGELRDAVERTMVDFFRSGVSFFDGEFRFSKFVAAIDATDTSIKGNRTELTMAKVFRPTPGVRTQYNFKFYNPFEANSVVSDAFRSLSGQSIVLKDDGAGYLDMYADGLVFRRRVGTVNYSTGAINIDDFSFDVAINTEIVIKAAPSNMDLFTVRNNLIVLRNSKINMTRYGS